jgi:hypothetical protein
MELLVKIVISLLALIIMELAAIEHHLKSTTQVIQPEPPTVNVYLNDKEKNVKIDPSFEQPGMFASEDETIEWLQQYGSYNPMETQNPFRGWGVYEDDEAPDGQ